MAIYCHEKLASKYAKAYWDKKEEKENSQLKLYKRFDKFTHRDYNEIIKFVLGSKPIHTAQRANCPVLLVN